jgi:hypothetical protein
MTLIIGIIALVVFGAALYYSIPRGGKTARFVGSEWEGYIVVAMISGIAMGAILTVSSLISPS